jgi:hypothetical protein
MRPTSAPSFNLQDHSPAAVIAGTFEASRSAKKGQASAAVPSVTPTKSSARRGKAALDDKVDTLFASVTPMRPTSAPSFNLQDHSPAAVIAGTFEASRSAKKGQASAVSQSQGAPAAPKSPVAAAASFSNLGFGTPIRSLSRRRPSAAARDDTAALAASAVPTATALSSPSQSSARKNRPITAEAEAGQPIDLTTKGSPERARVRKYSILHPDAALSSAAVDISEDSARAYSPQVGNDQFEAHADGVEASTLSDACGAQRQHAQHHLVLSAQSAEEIASVFLEVVHASCAQEHHSGAAQQMVISRRFALKDHACKENKESNRQLASIIKSKAPVQQPLEEYKAARFAQRMQLCAPCAPTHSMHCAVSSCSFAQVRRAQQRPSSSGCRPEQNTGTTLKALPSSATPA